MPGSELKTHNYFSFRITFISKRDQIHTVKTEVSVLIFHLICGGGGGFFLVLEDSGGTFLMSLSPAVLFIFNGGPRGLTFTWWGC